MSSASIGRAVEAVAGPAVARRLTDAVHGHAHVGPHPLVEARPHLLVDPHVAVPDMLESIANARRSVEVAEYILQPFGDGHRILEALRARARGDAGRAPIEVSVLVDRMGSMQLPLVPQRLYYRGLERDGVRVVRHESPLNPFAGGTDHRKLFVIDGERAYVGGMGFSEAAWHDVMVRVDGPVAAQAHAEFVGRWVDAGGTVSALQRRMLEEGDELGQHPVAVGARLVANAHRGRADSTEATFAMARAAQDRLWIHTPFFGSAPMADLLAGAARAGVDTRLAVNGDRGIPVMPLLSRSFYRQLTDGTDETVRVFEQPEMSHQKLTLADDWAAAGSMNIAPRALRHDHELNIVSNEPGFRRQVEAMMRTDEARGHRVTDEDLERLSVRVASNAVAAPLIRRTLGSLA